MTPSAVGYENLPEPPGPGLQIGRASETPFCTVAIDDREIEVISVRLDSDARPPRMHTWLFLRAGPALTMLLHTCGDGSGWREVDEGTSHFTIRSDSSSDGYMAFTCLRCASIHRMRGDGFIDWPGMIVDDYLPYRSRTREGGVQKSTTSPPPFRLHSPPRPSASADLLCRRTPRPAPHRE